MYSGATIIIHSNNPILRMRRFLPLLLVLTMAFSSCTPELQKVLTDVLADPNALTTEQIAQGLKEALVQGISKGSDRVSQVDGYYKNPTLQILFPPEAQKVEKTLRDIGAGAIVDDAILKLNRAAEDAAKEAKPIFVSAIRNMTFQDATAILMGEDPNAATQYLQRTTSSELYSAFSPTITNSLNKVGALDIWTQVMTRYNRIPFVEKVNPDLADYVTRKAMDGLFLTIAEEEALIRKDPVARTTDLLKRVFAKQD